MSDESLSSILKSESPSTGESAAPPAAVVETREPVTEPVAKSSDRDEQGRFKPAEKPAEAVKADPPADKPKVDVAAIIDERRKRQALEAKIREMEAAKPAPKVSVFDNEDQAISQRLDEGTKTLRQQNYALSVKLARMEHKDAFTAAESAFIDAAEADPRLYEGLRASADPGEYIYTIGTQIAELAPVGGDFAQYREKVTGELKTQLTEAQKRIAALESQLAEKQKAQAQEAAIPRSLNNRASGASPGVGAADPEDIGSIVRFNTKTG